jgi:hypothetical protein
MPILPLMPTGADQVQTPMPGGPPSGAGHPPPMGPGPGGDLASLLGVGGNPSSGMGMDPIQGALGHFDQLAQMVADLARTFPGSEQMASQMMEVLDQWRQQILVMITPQPSSMPGADTMM